MKGKHLVCLAVLLALAGLTGYAQGYTGPGLDPVTVAEAKNLRDDSPVVLRGKIERFLGDEKYLFSDDSGTITVEIDNRLWTGLSVNQNDTVEISGEVDKDFRGIEIEVNAIKKL
ncbi:MAG: NirD/YgiW/YdeI family stress tolerance protein [Treponema sp.]|jgi:uncharacterized protein (TIGR00156 family)|nr:NirD/YgiW/YdeI family stress tolerance protein [Treponema sp.]